MAGSWTDSVRLESFGPLRICIIVAQLLTGCAFLITLGGLAELQHKVNHLGIQELTLLSPVEGAAATTAYVETFQSANQIPYPDNGPWQFGIQWYAMCVLGIVSFGIFLAAILPGLLHRVKPVAMAFLPYLLLIGTYNVNSLLYFHRSAVTNATLGGRAIKVTLIGTIMGDVFVGSTIIFLGLIRTDSDYYDGRHAASSTGSALDGRRKVAGNDVEANGGAAPTATQYK